MNQTTKSIITILGIATVAALIWYFKNLVIYIIVAAIIAMIGRPLVEKISSLKFKKFKFPRWAAAGITLVLICCIILSILLLLAPMIGEFSTLINSLSIDNLEENIREPLRRFNEYIINTFPNVDKGFKVEGMFLGYLKDIANIDTFSSFVTSLTNMVTSFAIAIFSIIFISFFLLMEKGLLTDTITAFFSDKYEEKIRSASLSITKYLSRYFIGISIESLGIALLNGLGLVFIAKMDTELAIVIAFTSGILNIIPYLGPLIGDILAVTMGLVFHLNGGTTMGLGIYLIIILGIFIITQFIDNYVFQPIIYSNSVKAHPLEIFIVILVAGEIGGVLGILAAVPLYTILRVILLEFLPDRKFVKRLIGDDLNQ